MLKGAQERIRAEARERREQLREAQRLQVRGTRLLGCFLKWWYPQSPPPKWSFLSRKTKSCWGNPPFLETSKWTKGRSQLRLDVPLEGSEGIKGDRISG